MSLYVNQKEHLSRDEFITTFGQGIGYPDIPPDLTECHCNNNLMGRSMRKYFVEDPLIEKIGQVFSKNKELILYSFGSGGCYQELAIGVRMARAGYQIKRFCLVDKIYEKLSQDKTVLNFSKLLHILFPEAQVVAYKTEDEYFAEIQNQNELYPDVILCIDVEDSFLFSARNKDYEKNLITDGNPCIFTYYNIGKDRTGQSPNGVTSRTIVFNPELHNSNVA